MTRSHGALALLILLAVSAGCGTEKELVHSDDIDLPQRSFVGRTLTVLLDGRQTRSVEGSDPAIWTAGTVSDHPTISFKVDDETFPLPVKQVNLTLCPVIDGELIETTVYKPFATPGQPGQEVVLQDFECAGLTEYKKVDRLPEGRYQLTLRVIGPRSWDQQVIRMKVKAR